MIKKILKIFFIIFLFLPLIAVAHFFVFPQETRCILIGVSGFSNTENVYHRKEVSAAAIQQVLKIKYAAEKKVAEFWHGPAKINYKLIYCTSATDYNHYGREGAPAVAYLKMGAYVVIPKDMFDVNIISHEISHTVLYRKIGWYNLHFKIPTWFDEGVAMQVDARDYYSIDTLLARQNKGLVLPDVTKLDTPEKFHSGSATAVMLNYSMAKYVVHEWLKRNSLDHFVQKINDGNTFEQSYNTGK